MRALEEPLRQLSHNAGLEGSVIVNQVRSAKKGQGLNVETGEIVAMVSAGIIDPTMVTRSALQNAASIAKNILTTEAIVVDAPEKASAGGGMPGGDGRHGRDGRLLDRSRLISDAEGRRKPALSAPMPKPGGDAGTRPALSARRRPRISPWWRLGWSPAAVAAPQFRTTAKRSALFELP